MLLSSVFDFLSGEALPPVPEAPAVSEERAAEIRAEFRERLAQIKNRHRSGSRHSRNY